MSTIAIVITTFPNHARRWEYFTRCIPIAKERIIARGHEIKWLCAAESDRTNNNGWYGDELEAYCLDNQIQLYWRKTTASLGSMMNYATELGSMVADYIMILQDDWLLLCDKLDLSPGLLLMDGFPEIDTIRYSWPEHLGVTVEREFKPGWRKLDPKGLWPYGDDPHIRRKSFLERFGKYIEGPPHGISEGDMVYRFGAKNAFVLINHACCFGHCGPVSAAVDGDSRRMESRK